MKQSHINILIGLLLSIGATVITVLTLGHASPESINIGAGLLLFLVVGVAGIDIILQELIKIEVAERRHLLSAFIFILKITLVFCVI